MIRIVTFFMLFMALLMAQERAIFAIYDVSFGIAGKIGIAEMNLTVSNDMYKISAIGNSKGIAGALSSNRVDSFESEGKIVNGEFVPLVYRTLVKNDYKYDKSIYEFYHEASKVLRYRERINEEKQIQISEEQLPYYAKDDLLTLFFNLKHRIKDLKEGESKELKAVGGEKKSGNVLITIPSKDAKAKLIKKFESDGKFVLVRINQPIFMSKYGELELLLDEDWLCKQAMMDGLLLFGDVRGKLIEIRYQK